MTLATPEVLAWNKLAVLLHVRAVIIPKLIEDLEETILHTYAMFMDDVASYLATIPTPSDLLLVCLPGSGGLRVT